MRYFISMLLLLLAFAACNKKGVVKNVPPDKPDTTNVVVRKPIKKLEDTFPFNKAKKIEVISYQVRYQWDTISKGDGVFQVNPLVKKGELLMPESRIKERAIFDSKGRAEIFDFLIIEDCNGGSVAACFDARNAILFYDNMGKIIANVEVCLDCANAQADFDISALCYERVDKLTAIFKRAGLKLKNE